MALRAVLAVLLLVAPTHPLAAQSGRSWRPEERVLISRFIDVGALATDMRRVYAATRHGLEIYDFMSRRWELPSTFEDGYPAGETPTALVYDRALNTLWLTTDLGGTYAYDISFERWQRFLVPAPDVRMQLEQYPARRVPNDPYLASARATLTQDDKLRRWPLTAAIAADRPGQFFIGTDGANIALFDSRRMTTEWLRFGLNAPGVSAVAASRSGVWIGNDGRTARNGIAHADRSLQTWELYESADGGPNAAVNAFAIVDDELWIGANDGLYQARGGRMRRYSERDGLPHTQVLSLAVDANGLWIGTRAGLVLQSGEGTISSPYFSGAAIAAVLPDSSSIWVASDRGLWHVQTTADADVKPVLDGTFIDVVRLDSTVIAAAPDGLHRRTGGEWTLDREPALRIGQLTSLAVQRDRLWVGGARGSAMWDSRRRIWTYFTVPDDLPAAPVRDIAVEGDDVWLALPVGALRIQLR